MLIVFFSFLYAYQLKPLSFIIDDAYIVIHNVQVLISGYDVNYPGVSALSGTTSLVHLALVRFFAAFVLPIWALYIVTWGAILFYAAGLLRLAFIHSASVLHAVLFFVSGLFIGLMPLNLLNGLETGLALALLIWTLIFITLEKRTVSNLLLGLMPFVRPELALLTCMLWLNRAPYYWQQQKNLPFVCLQLMQDLLTILISALPFVLWYYIALGIPYPQTLAAKRYFFAQQHLPFLLKTFIAFKHLGEFAVTLGIFNFISMLVLMLFIPLSRTFLLFLMIFFLFYLLILPGALCFNGYRYLYLWLPLMLYGVIACNKHPYLFIRFSGYISLLILFSSTLFYLPLHYREYLGIYHYTSQTHANLTHWYKKNLPPDSTILLHDAGFLSDGTRFHLIDLVGLKTPSNIYYNQQFTFPSNGQKRGLAIAEIIRTTHPQYLIITEEWERFFHFNQNLKQQGISLQEIADINTYIIDKINY
jgi:hypothetical protein